MSGEAGLRSTTGSSPATTAACSCSAPTTPIRRAMKLSSRPTSWRVSPGWGWTGTRGSKWVVPTAPIARPIAWSATGRWLTRWSLRASPTTTGPRPSSSRRSDSRPRLPGRLRCTTDGTGSARPKPVPASPPGTRRRCVSDFPVPGSRCSTMWCAEPSNSIMRTSTTSSYCVRTARRSITSPRPWMTSTMESPT